MLQKEKAKQLRTEKYAIHIRGGIALLEKNYSAKLLKMEGIRIESFEKATGELLSKISLEH